MSRIIHPKLNNIDDFLRSRQKNPVATLELFKDVCKRIKALEKKS